MAEDLMPILGQNGVLTNFLPEYLNQAIIFTGDDMGGDKSMIMAFLYIVVVILAFVFSITISNNITKEANVIGTLRASGYSRGEKMCIRDSPWHGQTPPPRRPGRVLRRHEP